jgi:(1->4)-alpha-D-glucan 1-alpha-D-glucosylmutase
MSPRATARLQFHRAFTFTDARKLVPYFAGLGISHLYASPIAAARPGSMHGYDVIDPTQVNPELGGEAALRLLVADLRAAGLGLIIDIVPNHMAADTRNAWWADVLANGRASRYARFFDIDWQVQDPALHGKVLLPVLGRPYAEALAAGELDIVRSPEGGQAVRYFEHLFPLSAHGMPDGNAAPETLHELLRRQHYRLISWRAAGDTINWRRFFDINELVCLRMEDDDAFEAVHALPFRLYAEGLVDGLRVDHVDGLLDPAVYCRRLRQRLAAFGAGRASLAPARFAYLVVEKILLRGETLPVSWECDGTTGYDFMDDVSALQHDAEGEAPLANAWAAISGRPAAFAPEESAARREIVARSFSAQIEACAAAFERLLHREPPASDLGRPTLRRVLTELLVHFPVYRTYGAAGGMSAGDREFLAMAVRGATATCLAPDRWAIDPLHHCMANPPSDPLRAADWCEAIARFQQLSAPVAAKAVEDTAFYRYGRLLSRNDVGFDIERFSDDTAAFHARVLRRQATHPHAQLATSTHDHKRGEDVRARLAVLSEYATGWAAQLPGWIEQSEPLRRLHGTALAPSAGDIAMLFQMIVGAWPLDLALDDVEGRRAFADRLADWQQKALREAKLASDWAAVDEDYEVAARDFVMRLLGEGPASGLLAEIAAFFDRIAAAGAVNGLAQALLKFTVPGVPDLYQGTEYWDFSLVDPDNRRPVDFAARAATLGTTSTESLVASWRDGRIKQAVVARALAVRRAAPSLFADGTYVPLQVGGEASAHVVAFARRHQDDWAIVVVPRLPSPLLQVGDGISIQPAAWKNTTISLGGRPGRALFDAFNGKAVDAGAGSLTLGALCGSIPVALLSTIATE